jgi:two-component system, chemotaxis family, chemotaxis protein CheY
MSEERTMLVVDDSPTMRQLLKFAIKRLGPVRILEAGNGEEALAHLTTERVDLMLTDINMPVMDGLTLIDRVRADPSQASLPIVVITTEGDQADRDRALSKGATDYLVKPIQGNAVASVLRRVLGMA